MITVQVSGHKDMTGYGWLFIFFLVTPVALKSEAPKIFGLFNRPTSKPTEDTLIRSCNCECGIRNDGARIVGGTVTTTNEFPWMVRLSYINRFYCGGTLINDRYVVTAAHCVKGLMWFLIKVTLGEQDMCNKITKPETRFVLRATIGDFSFFNFKNDIAVLRLNDRVPISDAIRPICLPDNIKELYEDRIGIVTGWGTTKEGGTTSCELQEVEMPILSNYECKANYSSEMISETMMCAGYAEGLKDSCQGDSGGPFAMQRKETNKYELVGIVSWGTGCARPGFPGVYTRVTSHLEWIKTHTKDGCFCNVEKKLPSN